MHKLGRLISYLLVVTILFSSKLCFAVEDPVKMLNGLADSLIVELKKNHLDIQRNPATVFGIASEIIVPHADIPEMSKRVLPPETWRKTSKAQKEKFELEFTQLLVRTYASALAQYKDQSIHFYPIRGGYQNKKYVQVKSEIINNSGPAIRVTYSLLNNGKSWRLYDLSVEGVSLLDSFRSQFASQLSQGDIDSLIHELSEHNAKNGG